MSLPERSADLLMQNIIIIEDKLIEQGVDKDIAEKIANETVTHLRKVFGGEHFYFPKGTEIDNLLKQHEIYKKFTGNNVTALSKEFGLSTTHIYRLLKKVQEKERDKLQPRLF